MTESDIECVKDLMQCNHFKPFMDLIDTLDPDNEWIEKTAQAAAGYYLLDLANHDIKTPDVTEPVFEDIAVQLIYERTENAMGQLCII